ncbi:MAG: erythrose-4-phosphate dehydrogenase [SAR86 cluster bacterium]|uniref:Erythrose-4-phosphate dehydrogenase n=1 Tax=SAR86 cluster bacterium TaxID=2030880 RepID=A0A2A5CIY5_9GAMM|nr:erythrose-4-phosphate dehydrogenase [Gammaproteobacteria bacterium AH-315-E17]PCJ41789.1 MAG: erythrose-4-phosphate dehydrogenase [SAR86 cluster bacterium]PCJ43834.1 MAG: erythrose-4-phosphate dehydrogenase [SAR86 cluster bacterium]
MKIAINGLGRIGRNVLRAHYERSPSKDLQIVALNELADLPTLAHLLQYDSTHGQFRGDIKKADGHLLINGDTIAVSQVGDINELNWQGIDLVLECTGAYAKRSDAEIHLRNGAKRVLFSQPASPDVDLTVVYGINHEQLRKEHTIISAASCTTYSSVPIIKVLDDALGIENGMITTIHSAMNDQPLIDAYHHTNLRLTRSAFQSIIPVETGLAKGIERILPAMAGKFEAQAIRVPTINVSALDMTIVVKKACSAEDVNQIIKAASNSLPSEVLGYTDEPLASCDFNHDSRSAIVDLGQTKVSGRHLVKILVWFDNEWAYANRMLDVAKLISGLAS